MSAETRKAVREALHEVMLYFAGEHHPGHPTVKQCEDALSLLDADSGEEARLAALVLEWDNQSDEECPAGCNDDCPACKMVACAADLSTPAPSQEASTKEGAECAGFHCAQGGECPKCDAPPALAAPAAKECPDCGLSGPNGKWIGPDKADRIDCQNPIHGQDKESK